MNKKLPLLPIFAALALALLGVAALLSRCGQQTLDHSPVSKTVVPEIEYPRERARRLAKQPKPAPSTSTPTPTVGRDKLARALSSPGKDGALVIEVNAIRHSPLVEQLLDCELKRNGDMAGGLQTLKDELGVDVTEDLDRVAFDKDVLAVSGFFKDLKLPAALGDGEAYGDTGRLFRTKDEGGKAMMVGKVGDELLVTGFSEEQVKAAIDRAEGRGQSDSAFPDGVVGGEVYGLVGPAFLADLLADNKDPAVARLAEVVKTTRLQVAVDTDAAISLDIESHDAAQGKDLGKALGGLIAAGRQQAQQSGDEKLAGLLDQGEVVVRDDGSVAVDVAVPGATLLTLFGCPAPTP